MMRWLAKNWILLIIYSTFAISGGLYLRGVTKYRSVDTWPWVGAEILHVGGARDSVPTQTMFGLGSTTIDSRVVEFRYSVEGQSYRSKMATPDGGGLPLNPLGRPWRAFYDPSSPEVAVLAPVPFRGTGFIVTAAFSGVFVALHLWFAVPGSFRREPKAE